jgi:hypothetical protein
MGTSVRTAAIPRRPDWRRTAALSPSRLQWPLRSAASSVASARGLGKLRATSTALPCGRGDRPSGNQRQRRTLTPVHEEAVSRTQLLAGRVEYVQIRCDFGVEPVYRGGGAQACGDCRPGKQVQAAQLQSAVEIAAAVDAIPNLLQPTGSELGRQSATGQELQSLRAGHHAALRVQQPAEVGVHAVMLAVRSPAHCSHNADLCTDRRVCIGERAQLSALHGVSA